MALLLAALLAVFLLPTPWNVVAVVAAAVWETSTAIVGLWYSRRGEPLAGAETLIGRSGVVVTRCAPLGQAKVAGEIWQARCAAGAEVGESVRVVGRDGLTLVVAREPNGRREA